MTRLTRTQGQRLCELIHLLRGWDMPGIEAAVRKAADLGPAADVCVAALRVAANPDANTPGLIPQPGTHWQQTTVAGRIAPPACHDHPDQPAGRCLDCRGTTSTPDFIRALREKTTAGIAADARTHHQRLTEEQP